MKSSWKFNFFCKNSYFLSINNMFVANIEHVDMKLKKYFDLQNQQNRVRVTVQRNSYVSMDYVGLRVLIPNGRVKISVLVKPEMVGFKFGSFIQTKRIGMGKGK